MKKLAGLAALAILLVTAQGSIGETESWMNEIAGGLVLQLPGTGDFDLYTMGYGVEVQYRNWAMDPIGLALSLGVGAWETDSKASNLGAIHTDFDGSVTTIPIGASALFYLYGTQEFSVMLEAGLRYVFADADVDFNRVVETGEGPRKVPSLLAVDDSVLGLLAVEADYHLNEQFLLFGSLGYQQDLARGEISTPTGPLRDNEFTSIFLRFGGKFVF